MSDTGMTLSPPRCEVGVASVGGWVAGARMAGLRRDGSRVTDKKGVGVWSELREEVHHGVVSSKRRSGGDLHERARTGNMVVRTTPWPEQVHRDIQERDGGGEEDPSQAGKGRPRESGRTLMFDVDIMSAAIPYDANFSQSPFLETKRSARKRRGKKRSAKYPYPQP
ncbi:hypothetical protein CCHR01_11629 [Colletotrichum chrysophilum]|uniref:Uncharacterized protein n=1 Tax=Colletotrichum chrysophilum TaxID=1836956 RepID=A0AAD9EEK4_9PEZI|nr:hypothetical protein CCHR01_11629 [Colletotrichum chrysophilum]